MANPTLKKTLVGPTFNLFCNFGVISLICKFNIIQSYLVSCVRIAAFVGLTRGGGLNFFSGRGVRGGG